MVKFWTLKLCKIHIENDYSFVKNELSKSTFYFCSYIISLVGIEILALFFLERYQNRKQKKSNVRHKFNYTFG